MTTTILIGDVREELRKLPAERFHCVVTSPPYWGLRDYSVEGQIGLEPTLGEHLAVMVDVFREVRRVLKAEGTVWLNYGDCYAAAPNGKSAADYKADGTDDRAFRDKPFSTVGPIGARTLIGATPSEGSRGIDRDTHDTIRPKAGPVPGGFLKPKDLCMIANRLAIALQDDGWYVRSEIIWHKPNPMPESVYDRPTSAHEKVWLLTKSEDYFYNDAAIREPVTGGSHARKSNGANSRMDVDRTPVSRKKVKVPGGWDVEPGAHGTINRSGRTEATYVEDARAPGVNPKAAAAPAGCRANASFSAAISRSGNKARKYRIDAGGNPGRNSDQGYGFPWEGSTRNARNVWTIAPKAFRDAHFATFPPELARRCIKAGVPDTVCSLCGEAKSAEDCGGICAALPREPGHVLDPFGGAGTVGLVAEELGLNATLIELNPDYAALADKRIRGARKPFLNEAAE